MTVGVHDPSLEVVRFGNGPRVSGRMPRWVIAWRTTDVPLRFHGAPWASSGAGRGWVGRGTFRLMSLDHLSLLARFQDDFLAAVPDADPAARVPACGDWTVRELVEHLAEVHHWAAGQARAKRGAPLGDGPFDLAPHYAAQAAELRATLAELDPDATGRVLAHPKPMGPGPVRFWHRRQTHETLIHLHDLLAASVGTASLSLVKAEPEVWADNVDEAITVLQPRQVGLGRMEPLRSPVAFVATDVAGPRTWVLGAPGERAEEVAPDVVVSGPAEGIALTLWRRLTPAEAGLTVEGDRADLEAALEQAIVP